MPRSRTATLPESGKTYFDVRGTVAGRFGDEAFRSMPLTSRILAENLLRRCPPEALEASLEQVVTGAATRDFPFFPARVVLQDLTGTPALVDLAGLRDAVAERGGDPSGVVPRVPTQMVVDHSLNVEVAGTEADAMPRNMAFEERRNAERFEFLAWCKGAFGNLDVLMPGNGILHQINLERMSPVVHVEGGMAYPDTLVGTDSHTPMINALGVLGWGVGGIEAESVMLGRATSMRMPELVAVRLAGRPGPGILATDVVLALTEFLRAQGVVGAILEFLGEGVAALSLPDRATIANMSPEFGATGSMFPIDGRTLDYLRLTGRDEARVRLVAEYAAALGMRVADLGEARYHRELSFDLASVVRCLAGPADPHQRVPLARIRDLAIPRAATPGPLPDGAVVLAAITSCTNTSNPRNLLAAGLLARKAVERGLARKPWVKTSLAPGSRVVQRYLESAGLLEPLAKLGFGIVGYGCTSCNGMSGPLPEAVEQEILSRGVHATAVVSGNRNFNGRVHPRVKAAFLASPALVVAYAIAGTLVDVESVALGTDARGREVMLADIWPTDAEIDALLAQHVSAGQFSEVYDAMFAPAGANPGRAPVTPRFPWREDSLYIRRPPYWEASQNEPARFTDMRVLALMGDNVTTDDLSPSGAILQESAAGEFLVSHGVAPADFNSYGTRRGDHTVTIRATFANNRLRNEMAGEREGSLTRLEPEGKVMRLFDAAERYLERGQELVIVAGKNYGSGSSRDWAAKGVRLLGVRAVVAESFERIHRSNLVGMGVLPVEFAAGTTRKTLRLDGSERIALQLPAGPLVPGVEAQLGITRRDGSQEWIPVSVCIETHEEIHIYEAGGLLPRIRDELLATAPRS